MFLLLPVSSCSCSHAGVGVGSFFGGATLSAAIAGVIAVAALYRGKLAALYRGNLAALYKGKWRKTTNSG